MQGINVAGVQFRRAGRIYDFSYQGLDLRVGDEVVVETDRGPSVAYIATLSFRPPAKGDAPQHKGKESAEEAPREASDSDGAAEEDAAEQPGERQGQGQDQEGKRGKGSRGKRGGGGRALRSILRRVHRRESERASRLTPDDVRKQTEVRINERKLKMRILKCEVQLGGNKVLVFFTAPGRVDFRDLVKDLASSLRSRVELKQVGARDETKLLGGVGICGREYCCSSFLREFVPVSIRMAKNQNLALNPSKVSGGCGRLLCCLTYENEVYKELRQVMPGRGARVRSKAEGWKARVLKADLLNQMVLVEEEDGSQRSIKVAELEIEDRPTAPKGGGGRGKRPADKPQDDDWGDDLDLGALKDAAAKSPPANRGGNRPAKAGGRGSGSGGGGRGSGSSAGGRSQRGGGGDQRRPSKKPRGGGGGSRGNTNSRPRS